MPRPRPSPVAPRIVRSERGLSRRLAKEDRHLRIAPRFFDRDETPAIFVTSLVFDQGEVVRHVERKYYRRRRAASPFAAVNVPFRLARTASRMLAGNWSTEIQIPGDPNNSATLRCGDRGIRVGRLGFFRPCEDPEFFGNDRLIRFGLSATHLGNGCDRRG
jgi:hypothetical protein